MSKKNKKRKGKQKNVPLSGSYAVSKKGFNPDNLLEEHLINKMEELLERVRTGRKNIYEVTKLIENEIDS